MSLHQINFQGIDKIISISLSDEEFKSLDLINHWKNKDDVVCGYFEEEQILNDVIRYGINITDGKYSIQNFKTHPFDDSFVTQDNNEFADYLANELLYDQSITLILESPHDEEYDVHLNPRSLSPKSPAIGSSGRNILKKMDVIIESLNLSDGEYNFIISNPVPFQTSLFELSSNTSINRGIRDKVWMNLICEDNIRNSFIERTKTYKSTAIINCCTGKLKPCVEMLLRIYCDNDILYNGIHPGAVEFSTNPKIRKLN